MTNRQLEEIHAEAVHVERVRTASVFVDRWLYARRLADPERWLREQEEHDRMRGQSADCWDILNGDYGQSNADLLEVVIAGMVAD